MKDLTATMTKGVRSATAFLKRCGMMPVKGHYSQGYHYNSGFFTSPKGRLWYWMTPDDRDGWSADRTPLIRTAEHLRDFTGGNNNYPKTADDLIRLIAFHDERMTTNPTKEN